jgi:hypothetical protein
MSCASYDLDEMNEKRIQKEDDLDEMTKKRMEKEEKIKKKVTEVDGNRGRSSDGRREHLYRGTSPPVQIFTCTPGRIPSTDVSPHLYRIVCNSWIPSLNEGSCPVQIVVFPV